MGAPIKPPVFYFQGPPKQRPVLYCVQCGKKKDAGPFCPRCGKRH